MIKEQNSCCTLLFGIVMYDVEGNVNVSVSASQSYIHLDVEYLVVDVPKSALF